MAAIHVTVAEAALDLPALLLKAQAGEEVQIDAETGVFRLTPLLGSSPPIVVRHTEPRPISVILAELKERNSGLLLDDQYGKDVEEFIEIGQRERWPSWDAS